MKSVKSTFISARGARKEATANVWLYLKPQVGVDGLSVNGKAAADYFSGISDAEAQILKPLQLSNVTGKVSVSIKVSGGGRKSQLEAAALGLAKALVKKDSSFRPILRREGLLTRDSRMVESKKWGRHGARRGQQFSKR